MNARLDGVLATLKSFSVQRSPGSVVSAGLWYGSSWDEQYRVLLGFTGSAWERLAQRWRGPSRAERWLPSRVLLDMPGPSEQGLYVYHLMPTELSVTLVPPLSSGYTRYELDMTAVPAAEGPSVIHPETPEVEREAQPAKIRMPGGITKEIGTGTI